MKTKQIIYVDLCTQMFALIPEPYRTISDVAGTNIQKSCKFPNYSNCLQLWSKAAMLLKMENVKV